MATFVDVLLGTDGLRDWALLPDGTKYMLGTTSVSKLVAELAPTGEARRALEAFLAGDKARIRVDVDRFFALLAPTRTRFGSSTDPLIYQGDRTSQPREGSTMSDYDQATKAAIQQWTAHLEQQIALLNQHAKEASPGSISADLMKSEVQKLSDLAAWISKPSSYGKQDQNSTFYGLPGGTPGGAKTAAEQQAAEEQAKKQAAQQQAAEEQAKKQAAEQQAAQEQAEQAKKQASTSKMSFDAFKANTALVDQTLRTLDATNGKIDRLVAAGKRFNAAKAKGDLTKIASRVSEICASVDLANTWLKDDLQALSKSASEIAALFPADA